MDDIEEDKKMEESEEDSKSMSSLDAKMEKISPPSNKSGESKPLEMIKELEGDAEMEIETEEILQNFDLRLFKIFSNSSQKESLPKKLLEKFQKLLKRIKKRIGKSQDKPKSSCVNRNRMLESLVQNDKKFSLSNVAKTTKRSFNSGSINMTSKNSDDNYNTLTIGIPGQTNYLVSCNKFKYAKLFTKIIIL